MLLQFLFHGIPDTESDHAHVVGFVGSWNPLLGIPNLSVALAHELLVSSFIGDATGSPRRIQTTETDSQSTVSLAVNVCLHRVKLRVHVYQTCLSCLL